MKSEHNFMASISSNMKESQESAHYISNINNNSLEPIEVANASGSTLFEKNKGVIEYKQRGISPARRQPAQTLVFKSG